MGSNNSKYGDCNVEFSKGDEVLVNLPGGRGVVVKDRGMAVTVLANGTHYDFKAVFVRAVEA